VDALLQNKKKSFVMDAPQYKEQNYAEQVIMLQRDKKHIKSSFKYQGKAL
jgi:hypothetical protein